MTNQIKYLLVPLALSVLVGCDKPEADTSGTDELASLTESERMERLEDICIALRENGFGNVAATLRDHGVPEGIPALALSEEVYEDVVRQPVEDCAGMLAAAFARKWNS